MPNTFERRLTGGHPNSLGNTLEVVEEVLTDKTKFNELFECYFSQDEIVRLRVSNAMKRITKEKPKWVAQYLDRLLEEVTQLNQASAQWTLSQLFLDLEQYMNTKQKQAALTHMKHNIAYHSDWIVLNQTMKTLYAWSVSDRKLREWFTPYLQKLKKDSRKSVSRTAEKYYTLIKNTSPSTREA